MLKNLFVVLHVIAAAGWFGLALRVGATARIAAAASAGAAGPLVQSGRRTVSLMNVFIVLALVFGLIAFFLGGGFAAYGPLYHTSILLTLLLVVDQFVFIHRGWSSLAGALGGAEGGSVNAENHRRKVAMGAGIGHLLWLLTLIFMMWRFYPLW